MSNIGFYIAASALDAQRAGMNTVAQDLANVNTPQYARERANLQTIQGSSFLAGGGVQVPSVSQVTNSVITAASLTADGLLSQQQATNQMLTAAQGLFPEPNGGGLQSQLARFWSEWDTVANEPANTGARQALVTSAQQVAGTLNQASNGLTQLQNQIVGSTDSSLNSTIAQANTLLTQVADLNRQIMITTASKGDANSLIDQRRSALDQLSQLIGTTYRDNTDGSTTVYLAGLELVQDAATLPATAPPPPLTVVTAGAGSTLTAQVIYNAAAGAPAVAVPPLGGTAGGLLNALTKITGYVGSLDTVASNLATAVNAQQAKGFYWANGLIPGSQPSATGPDAYQGNVDTSGNPLAIFVNSATQLAAGVTAANVGMDKAVALSPFYLAASGLAPTAYSFGPVTLPVTITAGVNDTITTKVNGGAVTITIPPGVYNTPAALQAAINAGIPVGTPLAAAVDSAGNVSLAVTGPNPGPNFGMSLQVTGGNALGTLKLTTAASASQAAQNNNGQNAQAMAELSNSLAGPDATYRSFISQLGADVQTSTVLLNTQSATTKTANQNYLGISGVSTDEETVQMQLYQNAYQAAGKVVAASQAMIQSLLQAV